MELSSLDLLLSPFYIILIIAVSRYIKNRNRKNPFYEYYVHGMVVKLVGAVVLCLIYVYYYKGGDTIGYFNSATYIMNLATKNFSVFIDVFLGNNSPENYSCFDESTGYPMYWRDDHAFFVCRFFIPFIFLACKSFVVSAMLLAWLCYTGIWKLYLLFCNSFPDIKKQLAVSILFIPSVVFWGSGLMKDAITISAVGWYTFAFSAFFIKRKFNLSNGFAILISGYLLIVIKPYIMFALLPGSILWLTIEYRNKIKDKVLRFIALPMLLAIGMGGGYLVLVQMSGSLGKYSLDNVLERAVVVQNDLKQDYYNGKTFDIGSFDASVSSMLGKAHLAIASALFRPYLWDVQNPVMLLSALENTYILLLTLFLMIRLKFIGFFKYIGMNPLLLFSVLFALFFAFAVGISTPNFGSLVRLRIPCIPFFVSSLFVIRHFYDKQKIEGIDSNSKRLVGLKPS